MGADPPLDDWEKALNECFSEEQQGSIFDGLRTEDKLGHVVVADIWGSLHRPTAKKLKGALEERLPALKQGSIALDTYYQMLDPQNRTESSVATDRSSCFTYYSANQKGKVRCTVLGANFDRQCIRAAHIMQRRWLGRAGTPAYKSLTDALGINSHNDVRNMLPMHLGVETLFDLGFICFRQVDNNDELLYEINVLNDKDPLMQLSLDQLATQKLASHEKHFGTQQRMLRLSSGSPKHTGRLKGKELDGMSFRMQAGDAPSKRCIAIHALLCIRLAERKGWINRGIMDIEEAAWLSPGCTKEKRQQLLSWIPDAL